jgi:hypothetical protein
MDETGKFRAYLPGPRLPGPGLTRFNILQRGPVSAVRVKLSLGGGLTGRSKWSILQRGRMSAIRVELQFPASSTLQLTGPAESPPGSIIGRSTLWVILERTRTLQKGLRKDRRRG